MICKAAELVIKMFGSKAQVVTYHFRKTIVQPTFFILKEVHEKITHEKIQDCMIMNSFVGGTNIYHTCIMKYEVTDEEQRQLSEKILSFNMNWKLLLLNTKK